MTRSKQSETKQILDTVNRSCFELQARGNDSLLYYEMRFPKKPSTLEASLRLLNDAMQCDSTMGEAKMSRARVYILLGEFRKAIDDIDELVQRFEYDSLLLFSKPWLYEQLSLQDSARTIYNELGQYYGKRLLKEPDNTQLIHHWLYCRFKSEGLDSVKNDLEIYRRKYRSDTDFIGMLDSIR